jgi:hypothetical protein
MKSQRSRMKYFVAGITTFFLAACSTIPKSINSDPITLTEISNTFDLREFGERTVDSEGHVFLGNRQVDASLMVGIGYGRKGNYLGLSPATLVALSPDLRSMALSASADDVRSFLKTQGLTVADIRSRQNELRELDTSDLRSLAVLSQKRVGISVLSQSFIQTINAILPSTQAK